MIGIVTAAELVGVVHNNRHLWKRTESTLFIYPLPPPQKRTLKCWFFQSHNICAPSLNIEKGKKARW